MNQQVVDIDAFPSLHSIFMVAIFTGDPQIRYPLPIHEPVSYCLQAPHLLVNASRLHKPFYVRRLHYSYPSKVAFDDKLLSKLMQGWQ